MNRNLFFNLIVALLISFSVSAQKKKIHFHSINSFALIGGETETGIAFQTINGVQFSNWFSGVGIGIDNYHYKTLPIIFDARRYFGSEKKAFVYGNLGYNFPMKNKPGKEIPYYNTYHFTGGVYTDIGIGFGVHLYKKSFMVFSLGYSYKKVEAKIGASTGLITPCPVMGGNCNVDYSNYDFSFNRMILKAGLVF